MPSRPWTWTLTGDGLAHATSARDVRPGDEVSAVCGAMVVTAPRPVRVGQVDPCLSCVQLVGPGLGERRVSVGAT